MSNEATFTGDDAALLRRLIHDGEADFELQVRTDPRMSEHIADSAAETGLTVSDYRSTFLEIARKMEGSDEIDYTMFNRDETQFIAHLAAEGRDTGPNTLYERNDRLVTKAEAMDAQRRSTDTSTTKTTYSRVTLEEAGKRLDAGDWDAHRKLAIVAVESGFAAEVEQDFNNDASDQQPLTHSIRILDPDDVQPLDTDTTEFDAMGGTSEVEQFTPDRPHGYYGLKTPFDMAPTDPEGPGNPVPSDAHLSALSAQPPHPDPANTGPSLS